jgi:L-Ala-D/L-Glu epimerase
MRGSNVNWSQQNCRFYYMKRTILVKEETWKLKEPFIISRGSRTETKLIYMEIRENNSVGRGESVPSSRYSESIESVLNDIHNVSKPLQDGISREEINQILKPGAARNAIDCALWDLEAKISKKSIFQLLNIKPINSVQTVQTVSIANSETMHKSAKRLKKLPILKIKLDSQDVIDKMNAVQKACPDSKFIIDANESWTIDLLQDLLNYFDKDKILLIEQPLPSGKDHQLIGLNSLIPIAADESCHTSKDLKELSKMYNIVNIKLDKTGGLTEALQLKKKAKELGLKVMLGCMLGTSLSMAPAILLASGVSFIDLDAPTLLTNDREFALTYKNGIITNNSSKLWG